MTTTITSINPKIETERSYRDLDLNFTAHPVKKDVSVHLNEKAVINSVKNLVSTNFYERPFQPELGSSIRALLFEPVDSVFGASIVSLFLDVVNNYAPCFSVESVVAIPAPDENGYKVTMTFFIINLPNPITINFFLERIR